MRPRLAVGCALVLAAAAPGFAQDWFEPNPSLARLSADDAYARESAKSLRTVSFAAAVAMRLDDAGRVVVVDASGRIARLDSDGRLDPTFGAAGIAETPVFGGGLAGVEIDSVGRIVVTGAFDERVSRGPGLPGYGGFVFVAARLLADGSLDHDFSGDGLLERDASNSPRELGAVHAIGSDGAMLAVAEKLIPDVGVWVGLVRITADGAIDATYGGGFAQIVRGSWVGEDHGFVVDFAVDSAGRAVVAAQRDSHGGQFVLRLDAAGSPDPTFFGYTGSTVWDSFAASQVALDGAGRIVGLDDAHFLRRLTDGAPDPAFSGDGFAWHLATGFDHPVLFNVNVRDGGELLQDLAVLDAQESADPDPDLDDDVWGGGELLAVATRADRWVLAKRVSFRDAKGRVVAHGIRVQAIDPVDPGAIVSTTYRVPDSNFRWFADLAIAPDGTSAYALGSTFVLRVDLAKRKALPLPDLRVKWLGWPHARDFAGGRYRVSARVRIRNASFRKASVVGDVAIGDGSFDGPLLPLVPLQGSATSSRPFTLRGRSSVVRRFTWEGTYGPADLAGARLSVRVRSELPDANSADNTATSRTISPLYAPR